MKTIYTLKFVVIFTIANGCTLKKSSDYVLRANENTDFKVDIFHAQTINADTFELRKRIPIVLLCRKRGSTDINKPFDLVFRLRDFQSRKYGEITSKLNYHDTWSVNTEEIEEKTISASDAIYFSRKRPDNGKMINLTFFPLDFPKREVSDYNAWFGVGQDDQNQNYWCDYGSKLSDLSPRIGEQLLISGRDANGKFATQLISVDWLQKDAKDGHETILTLAPNAQKGWSIVGEPVFNIKNELVGFVETYSPGAYFGITIRSVHDRTFGAQVNDWVAQRNWRPEEPKDTERGPSLSVVNKCSCIARDAKPHVGTIAWFYRACSSIAKFGIP